MNTSWGRSLFCIVIVLGVTFSPLNGAWGAGPTKIRLHLEWKIGGQHAPLFAAKELGTYRERGLDVEILEGSGSSDTVKLLANGSVEFGYLNALMNIVGRQRGIPIVSLAVVDQKTPVSIISLKESNITQPRDLLGKVIGANPKSTTYQILEGFLLKQGIRKDQLTIAPIGWGVEPLLSKQVQALMAYTNNEPPLILAKTGQVVNEILVSDYGISLYGITLTTTERFLQENSEASKNFVLATLKAWRFAEENPEKVIEVFLKLRPEQERATAMATLKASFKLHHSDATAKGGPGWQTEEGWAQTQDVLQSIGLIQAKVDKLSTVFSNRFLGQ